MKEKITEKTTYEIVELVTQIENEERSKWLWKGIDEEKSKEAAENKDKAWYELRKILIKLEMDM